MEYILENPTFTKQPVVIDNEKAVELIDAYVNRPKKLILDDEILLSVNRIIIKLRVVQINENKYVFKQVK